MTQAPGHRPDDTSNVGDRPVFRFAPSPTGALHLGHARSALLNADFARRLNGRLLLRIEDIDTTRLREEHVDWIIEDLAWLGVSFEAPVLRQSTRFEVYRAAADRLRAAGLLYPCYASRTEIAAAGDGRLDPDGSPLYPGLWRGRSPREVAAAERSDLPVAWRLDMPKALTRASESLTGAPLRYSAFAPDGQVTVQPCDPARWGDVVVVRKETPTSYHLAVVVDDAAQGVSHIVRGVDLLAATDVHRLLQVLLGLPEPLYHHHSLITDAAGRKLAKSAGDTSLRALRATGVDAAEIRRRALAR